MEAERMFVGVTDDDESVLVSLLYRGRKRGEAALEPDAALKLAGILRVIANELKGHDAAGHLPIFLN